MRRWLRSLTTPRGFAADGRTLGLGLATAMRKQRESAAREAEEFLRNQPVASPKADAAV